MILNLLDANDLHSVSLVSQEYYHLSQWPSLHDLQFDGHGDVKIWRVALRLLSRPRLADHVRFISFRNTRLYLNQHEARDWFRGAQGYLRLERHEPMFKELISTHIGRDNARAELRSKWRADVLYGESYIGHLGLIITMSTKVRVIDLELSRHSLKEVQLLTNIVSAIFSRRLSDPNNEVRDLKEHSRAQQRFDNLEILRLNEGAASGRGRIPCMRTLQIEANADIPPPSWSIKIPPLLRHAASFVQALELITIRDHQGAVMRCVADSLLSGLKRLVLRDFRLAWHDSSAYHNLIEAIAQGCPQLEHLEFSAKNRDNMKRSSKHHLSSMTKLHTLIGDLDLLPLSIATSLPPNLEHFGLTVSSPAKIFDNNDLLWGPQRLFSKTTLTALVWRIPLQTFTIEVTIPSRPQDRIPAVEVKEWHRCTDTLLKSARQVHDERKVALEAYQLFTGGDHKRRLRWVGMRGFYNLPV